jgi:membrane dipeptidase
MSNSGSSGREKEEAMEIHKSSIIVQGLDFTPEDKFSPEIYPALKASGITAMNLTISRPYYNFQETLSSLYQYFTVMDELGPEKIQVGRTAEDIKKAKESNYITIILGLQNTKPIGDNIKLLTILSKLGIRIIQLTYQNRNLVGDGCNEKNDCGLTRFGEKVVSEMNHLGMLIDLSHVGPKTTIEAIELSEDPCAFTHTCSRAHFGHMRNKTDEQLKALSEKGGVIGIAAYSPFYHHTKRPTIEDYLNQVDYITDLVGIDHVGIGLDIVYKRDPLFHENVVKTYPEVVMSYKWDTIYPEGLEDITKLPRITEGLVNRGYSNRDIKRILGMNFIRLFEKVWK